MVKNPPANTGDVRDKGSILESERSLGGGNGNPLQYSCLEIPGYSPWGCKKSDTTKELSTVIFSFCLMFKLINNHVLNF